MTTPDWTDNGQPPLTVAHAVDRLCGYCLEAHLDWKHARAGQRDAQHRWQQLALELRQAEGYGYLDDDELHAMSVELDRADRLMEIRTSIAKEAAIEARMTLSAHTPCKGYAEVLFPDVLLQVEL